MTAPASTAASMLPWDLVIVVTIGCLIASGFYSGCETGLMSASRVRLRRYRSGRRADRVGRLTRLLNRPEEPILACLVGTNLFNVLSSAVMTVALTVRFGARGEIWAMLLMSMLVIVFAEILPKLLFREYPERLTLAATPPLRLSMLIMTPLLWLLREYTHIWHRLLPDAAEQEAVVLDRGSLSSLLVAHTPSSRQDRHFRAFLKRFLELAHLDLARIMRPIERVVTVPRSADVATCLQTAARSGFSRLPVQADDGSDLEGFILVRDLLLLSPEEAAATALPPALLRTCLRVDVGLTPYELFEELHEQGQQLAVVVDRSGAPLGVITLEDLIEAVVGSIQDEFDRAEPRISEVRPEA